VVECKGRFILNLVTYPSCGKDWMTKKQTCPSLSGRNISVCFVGIVTGFAACPTAFIWKVFSLKSDTIFLEGNIQQQILYLGMDEIIDPQS
jgi:hypothetical protein